MRALLSTVRSAPAEAAAAALSSAGFDWLRGECAGWDSLGQGHISAQQASAALAGWAQQALPGGSAAAWPFVAAMMGSESKLEYLDFVDALEALAAAPEA
jgi:hypothetical protein